MRTYPFIAAVLLAAAAYAVPAAAQTCVGSCGELGADGVVTESPVGGVYGFVTTSLSPSGGGALPGVVGSTNGSRSVTAAFEAAAGDSLEFYFNYVTSDGAGFSDYGWSQLQGVDGSPVATLFSARTTPTGSVVPGFGLPGLLATLEPASTPIIAGAPSWTPLGDSSGFCFDAGCGYTGWIRSSYTIAQAGTYQLAFGASNTGDSGVESGLAFDGVRIAGAPVDGGGGGDTAANPFLPVEVTTDGFRFAFTVNPTRPFFIDPIVATGYDYIVNSGPNIASALFPELGDPDGYELFGWDGAAFTVALGAIAAGEWFDFAAGGVDRFAIRGISADLGLDPANPLAFVTGLNFAGSGPVDISMNPLGFDTGTGAVPEPATWAMMIAGFGLVGLTLRHRRPLTITC